MKTCKDCLHYEACKPDVKVTAEMFRDVTGVEPCKYFTDRSEWLHLPCKVGTEFWYLGQYAFNGELTGDFTPCFSYVSCFEYDGVLTVYDSDGMEHSVEKIYLTREEAEKALERMKENDRNLNLLRPLWQRIRTKRL